ncbi:DNA topoisomerase 3 [Vagococcus sp. DIV0080]|uniref:DNA topoisomerase n=1 Tax=Candidatus Vagococcus giribetii TaxID=2230876 RepID=A0ABS3HTP3_9ENTE|nr:DNA topoisomerase 3 [Vagococcus sp. DIV0080]MBO0477121.1 DNA topoisomerase 3 [Vagococcus sp. DIV0080]
MKQLIIAEKPSVARDIASVLGATQKSKNYIEGKNVIVTWALGHLLGLKMPEDYNKDWTTWEMNTLPMIPKKTGIKPLPKTRPQLKAISQLANRADVSEAVIATDAGREGELVARWILQYVKFKKPVKRLWISSQTDKAIKDGFKNLKPSKMYDDLYYSAIARAESDWLVGLNVTRALTVKYKDSLSAGRVQTPTLAMVRRQEEKQETFKPENYFTLDLTYQGLSGKLQLKNPRQYKERQELEKLIKQVEGTPIKVVDINEKTKKEGAPLPYDLTEMQREANARYQYSAKKTLSIIQRLYETHKIVTYPRTDSKYLTTDLKQTMKDRLQAVTVMDSDRVKGIIRNGGTVLQKSVFQDKKVTDHHGLIPTEQAPRLEKLDNEELKIYRLIVERFLGLFEEPFVSTNQTIKAEVKGYIFLFRQSKVETYGWKQEKETTQKRVDFKIGQVIPANFVINKELTTPPASLNEGTLLGQMEKHNLGTPATRAEIIEKLISSELMERSNSKLSVTPKGKQLLTLVNPSLVTPELTQKWEISLEKIAQGQLNYQAFIKEIEQETTALVKEIKMSEDNYVDHSLTTKVCPDCGEKLREKNTRDGKIYVCSSEGCSYRRRKDPKLSNRRCSQCKKKMEILENKNGAYFKCKNCNITEKLDPKGKKNKKMTKHETNRLMKKVNQEEEQESPLALALKAAMEKK